MRSNSCDISKAWVLNLCNVSGFVSISSAFFAISSISPTSERNPVMPCLLTSGIPPVLEETTGTLGALTEGFSEGLKKAGFGALEAKLGLGEALQSTKDMVAAGEGNVSKMEAAGHLAKQLGSNLIKSVGPAVLLSAAFTKLVSAFKEVDKLSGDSAKELGISYEEAQGLTFEMNQAASYSKDLQNNTAGLMKAQSSLNSMFGTSVEFSGEMAKEFDSVQKRLKLSDETMGSFTKLGL